MYEEVFKDPNYKYLLSEVEKAINTTFTFDLPGCTAEEFRNCFLDNDFRMLKLISVVSNVDWGFNITGYDYYFSKGEQGNIDIDGTVKGVVNMLMAFASGFYILDRGIKINKTQAASYVCTDIVSLSYYFDIAFETFKLIEKTLMVDPLTNESREVVVILCIRGSFYERNQIIADWQNMSYAFGNDHWYKVIGDGSSIKKDLEKYITNKINERS